MSGAPQPALIEARGLVKAYPAHGRALTDVRAVDGVDLQVRRGETLGLVGESGCGKTTLSRCLVRLERPTSGSVVFDGTDITQMSAKRLRPLRRDFQIIFQDPAGSLDPRMNVGQLLTEGLRAHQIGSSAAERRQMAIDMLEEVGLGADAMREYPGSFSGGQQQRIGIARALLLRPRLLVADEPVSSLDVSVQAQILNLLVRLKSSYGLTMLFVAHDLAVVAYVSDRVAVMYRGRIVEAGDPAAIVKSPAHPYTAGLLAAVPGSHFAGLDERPVIQGDPPSMDSPMGGCRYYPRCPLGSEICLEREPPLTVAGDGRHVACHFPWRIGAPAVDPGPVAPAPPPADSASGTSPTHPTTASAHSKETTRHD